MATPDNTESAAQRARHALTERVAQLAGNDEALTEEEAVSCAAGVAAPVPRRALRPQIVALLAFLVITIGGLTLAKWYPYILKGTAVAAHHKLGKSIVSGGSASSPAGWHAALSYAVTYGKSIWLALVVGLLMAAGIQELLPRDWLLRVLGTPGTKPALLAGAAAVPSMMCTCCSAPAAVSLARSRASAGATIAYWLGNPVLNPATIVFMGFVLGWRWAALRIVVGIVLVCGAALLAQRLFGRQNAPKAAVDAVMGASATDSRPLLRRYVATLARLCVGLLPEYAVIVLVLGAVRAFLFPTVSPAAGHALWFVLLLAVTGTLMVIPTAGEVPIVQSFMRFGLSGAGGGALMITLPAISLPSLAMVGRAVPRRVLLLVTLCVVAAGLITAAAAAALGL